MVEVSSKAKQVAATLDSLAQLVVHLNFGGLFKINNPPIVILPPSVRQEVKGLSDVIIFWKNIKLNR